MALTAEQLAARREVPASFVPALMAGDEERIMRQFQIVMGEAQEEDLSHVWDVQRGVALEPAILDWHQRKSGYAITRRGESVTHPTRPYVSATLDGMQTALSLIIDAKAPGRWRKVPDVVAYYTPQMVVQKACVGVEAAALLVSSGGDEPELHILEWTPEYEAAVWERIDWFWSCVQRFTPPFAVAPIAAPVPVDQWRTVDMTASNEWGDAAGSWLLHAASAKAFEAAAKAIKGMVETDVGTATGHGITVTRAKNGALTIKAAKAAKEAS
jgi:hypothetical protein